MAPAAAIDHEECHHPWHGVVHPFLSPASLPSSQFREERSFSLYRQQNAECWIQFLYTWPVLRTNAGQLSCRKWRKTATLAGPILALYPGSWWPEGKKRVWNSLFANALNFPQFWKILKSHIFDYSHAKIRISTTSHVRIHMRYCKSCMLHLNVQWNRRFFNKKCLSPYYQAIPETITCISHLSPWAMLLMLCTCNCLVAHLASHHHSPYLLNL